MRALFLGAHPDDVVVSAGGTLRTLVDEGWEVWISPQFPASWERTEEGIEAAKILGATYMPVSHLDQREAVDYWSGLGFDLIVTPSSTDSHQDHRDVFELGYSLARKNTISFWEMNHAIPGGIYGVPNLNHFVMFNPMQQNLKQKAINAHRSQVEKYGIWWTNTIWTRDRYYGLMASRENSPFTYAEGFHIVIG